MFSILADPSGSNSGRIRDGDDEKTTYPLLLRLLILLRLGIKIIIIIILMIGPAIALVVILGDGLRVAP